MDEKDIKVGETYLLPVTVTTFEKGGWIDVTTCNNYEYKLAPSEVKTLRPIMQKNALHQSDDDWVTKLKDLFNLMNGRKNTENFLKYDPYREFCEGDKVSVMKIHGKLPQCRYNGMVKVNEGDCCTIHKKEGRNCYWVTIPSGGNWCFDAAYLELVTPVEELEPYYVKDDGTHYVVGKRPEEPEIVYLAEYSKDRHPHAEEAAEAERDRLNAEYRKEMEK